MFLDKKKIEYSDLVISFNGCPLGYPVYDCPFVKYWDIQDPAERIEPIAKISEETLDNMRTFHRKCILEKVKQIQEESIRVQL